MSANAIARRYAKAMVELGTEEGAVARYNAELTGFSRVLSGERALALFFANPAYREEKKVAVLTELVARLKLSTTVSNLLMLLLERGRLSLAPLIARNYGALADELSGTIRPTVTSGLPLEPAQVEEIRRVLARATGKKVELELQVDPSLIGGVVAKIGDKVFDGSVRTQLARLQDILQKG